MIYKMEGLDPSVIEPSRRIIYGRSSRSNTNVCLNFCKAC